MKKIIFIAILFATMAVSAQKFLINGKVLDGELNKEPLAFARVTVMETEQSVLTDLEGTYQIPVEKGTYTLVFDFLGYRSKKITNVIVKEEVHLNTEIAMYTREVLMDHIITASKD